MTFAFAGEPAIAPMLFGPPQVQGMDVSTQNQLDKLVHHWALKHPRNLMRQAYMDAKVLVKNIGIAVSDDMAKDVESVCGWPEKAVYALANMCMWDGVTSPDGAENPFEVQHILDDNRFDVELPQAIVSSMAKAVVFESVTPGDVASGEPPVIIMSHSADWASALWDRRRRAVSAAMLINDADDLGRPTVLTVLTPTEAVVCETHGGGWFVSDVRKHGLSRVPVEALPFRPSLERPFGRSRLSRPILSITDRAIRAALRMDISSELFTVPGLLLNGITEEQWEEVSKWKWRIGAVKGLSRDEQGDVANVNTLPQVAPTPHVEQLRELAAEFAGVASIPLSSLGIVQDNPASADAIYAAKEELVIEAHNANIVYGYALNRIYQNAIMIRDGLSEMSEELRNLATRWRNPAMPSIVSQSDAMVKQISAIPELAETDVALEEMGYTAEQIMRIRSQIRRAKASESMLTRLAQPQQETAPGDDAQKDQAGKPAEKPGDVRPPDDNA